MKNVNESSGIAIFNIFFVTVVSEYSVLKCLIGTFY